MFDLAGRVALGMNVRDFLELQRAFESNGVVDVPANVHEVFEHEQLLGKGEGLRIRSKYLIDLLRHTYYLADRRVNGCVRLSPDLRDVSGENEQSRELRGEALGCGDRVLFACECQ